MSKPEDESTAGDRTTTGHIDGNTGVAVGTGAVSNVNLNQTTIYAAAEKPALYVNVPSMPNHFVGREALIETVVARLLSGQSLAFSAAGLGGVGKTTLAVALAHHARILEHFRDGVLWAGLGPEPDVMSQFSRWGGALGIDLAGIVGEAARAAALKDAIGSRALLLVIDDAWDLASAELLRCGGPRCCHILTTRDQRLAERFAGAERVAGVGELDPEPAYGLLQKLAPKAYAADPDAAQGLVEAVGRLPLAIELLGGYLAEPEHSYFPELSAAAFAAMADPGARLGLAQRRLGSHGGQSVTLQETLALSLADLSGQTVEIFHALGAFAPKPDRFHHSAAVEITGAALPTLALLAARHLVALDDRGWLSLHQTVADLARTATPPETHTRHRDYYLALVNEDWEEWQRIEAIYGQIKWAWAQQHEADAENEALLDFHWVLRTYQRRRGLWEDLVEWAEHGLHLSQNHENEKDTANLLNELGLVYADLGEKAQALGYYEQALPLFRAVGDRGGEASMLTNIGAVYADLGEKAQALGYYEMALPLFQAVGNRGGEAMVLSNIGGVYDALGEKAKALETFDERALPLMRAVGDRGGEASTLNNIGLVYADLGEKEKALEYYEQALPLRRAVRDRGGEASTLTNIGGVYAALGEKAQALETFDEALSLWIQVGDRFGEIITRWWLGVLYRADGRLMEAVVHLETAVEIAALVQSPSLAAVQQALDQTLAHLSSGDQ